MRKYATIADKIGIVHTFLHAGSGFNGMSAEPMFKKLGFTPTSDGERRAFSAATGGECSAVPFEPHGLFRSHPLLVRESRAKR